MNKSNIKVIKDDDLYFKAVDTVRNAVVSHIQGWGIPAPTEPIDGVTLSHMYVTSAYMAPGALWVS